MRTVLIAAAATAAAAATILLAWDGPAEVIGYELVIAAIALGALRTLPRPPRRPARPAPLVARVRRRPRPPRPPQLETIERLVAFGTTAAADAEIRLLPLLRSAARDRLHDHHRIDLEHDPDAARRLLGDEAWDLLRPDRKRPSDRMSPGIPLEQLEHTITAVEHL